jgi:Tfp pilus assembly protein PilE
MNKRTSHHAAFTLVEISIILALLAGFALIAIPAYKNARNERIRTDRLNACINNMRQLDGAIQLFALENKKAGSESVTLRDCTPYLKLTLICPSAKQGATIYDCYRVTTCGSVPKCVAPGGGEANGHKFPL